MKYAQALVANTKMRLTCQPESCSALPADKGGRTRLASRPRLASVVAASTDSFRLSCACPCWRCSSLSLDDANDQVIPAPQSRTSQCRRPRRRRARLPTIRTRPALESTAVLGRPQPFQSGWQRTCHVLAHEALPPQPPLGNLRAHALYNALPRGLSLVRVRAAERAPPCPTPYASTIVCAGRGPACLSV